MWQQGQVFSAYHLRVGKHSGVEAGQDAVATPCVENPLRRTCEKDSLVDQTRKTLKKSTSKPRLTSMLRSGRPISPPLRRCPAWACAA